MGRFVAIWNDILQHVRLQFAPVTRDWFDRLQLGGMSNGVITVVAENIPQVRYLEEHCRRAFADSAQAATGRLVTVRFESAIDLPESAPLSFENDQFGLPLVPDLSFENFITGPCNRMAHAASLAVSQQPGKSYNPLFIHGDVGLGKTHLLQAICQSIQDSSQNHQLLYISCETFSNHFLEAVERGALNQFRYRYRHIDTLVIDDIQFLANRERSQEEFFHTFNTLHQGQRQIVLSADCCPEEIPKLEERLISRFKSGLVTLVDRPCLETRIAIVRAKAKLRGIEMPEDVATLVATRIESNVRELEGALSKIDLFSQTEGATITLPLAMEALGVHPPGRMIAVPDILNLVSKRYNVRPAEILSKRRMRSIVLPRQVSMYLAREMTPLSYEEIGVHFGGRDHTTVMYAHRLIADRCGREPELSASLDDLASTLRNGIHEQT